VRSQHLGYYVDYLESVHERLFGPEQGVWLARLDLERENVLAAHAWCEHAADGVDLDLRLANVTRVCLTNRGLYKLALQLTREAMARPGAERRTAARSRACFDAGWICVGMGQFAAAQAVLEEGLAIAREIGDIERGARILQPLGIAALGRGDRNAARAYFEEAVTLARQQGDRRELAAALNGLAQFHRAGDELALAEPLYEHVLALARELGDRESIGIGLLNQAMVTIERGQCERTRVLLSEALDIGVETGSRPVLQSVVEVSAGLALAERAVARGAFFFGIAEAQNKLTGMWRDPADEAFLAPLVAAARSTAAAEFAEAERAGAVLTWDSALREVRAFLVASPDG